MTVEHHLPVTAPFNCWVCLAMLNAPGSQFQWRPNSYSTKASNWNEELAWLGRREKVCIRATLGREFSFPSRVASTATHRNSLILIPRWMLIRLPVTSVCEQTGCAKIDAVMSYTEDTSLANHLSHFFLSFFFFTVSFSDFDFPWNLFPSSSPSRWKSCFRALSGKPQKMRMEILFLVGWN